MAKIFRSLFLLIATLLFTPNFCHEKPIHFSIFLQATNAEENVDASLNSIFTQTYTNWSLYYLNKNSTDQTWQRASLKIHDDKMSKKCKLFNLYDGEHTSEILALCLLDPDCEISYQPRTVVVLMDGNDILTSKDALQKIAAEYTKNNAWYVYANYEDVPGKHTGSHEEQIPRECIDENAFRSYPWTTKHLKTFYGELFLNINPRHLKYHKTATDYGWETSITFPLLEMASKGHIRYVPDVLYKYQKVSPAIKVYEWLMDTEGTPNWIRSKKPYKPLKKLVFAKTKQIESLTLFPLLDTYDCQYGIDAEEESLSKHTVAEVDCAKG